MFQSVLSCSLFGHTHYLSALSSWRLHTLPKWGDRSCPQSQFKTLGVYRLVLHTEEPASLWPPTLLELEFVSSQREQGPLTAKPETDLGKPLFRNGFAIKLEIQFKKERKGWKKREWNQFLVNAQLPDSCTVTSWQTSVCCFWNDVCPTTAAARGIPVPYVTAVTKALGKQSFLSAWGWQHVHQRDQCLSHLLSTEESHLLSDP